MSLEFTSLLLLAFVFTFFGFALGWTGGVAEGRERERASQSKEPPCPTPGS